MRGPPTHQQSQCEGEIVVNGRFGSSRDKEAVFVNDRFGVDFCRSPAARTTIIHRPSRSACELEIYAFFR